MSGLIATLLFLLDLAIKLVALGVVPRNRKPSSAMAWLLLILVIPFVGIVLFLVLGRTRLERRRLQQLTEVEAMVAARSQRAPAFASDVPVPTYVAAAESLNRSLGALPLTRGNQVELLPGYGDSIAAMAAEIEGAHTFVHAEFYITAWDDVTAPVFEAMVRAVERGVRVRLLFDHLGSRGIPGYKNYLARLEASGVDWQPMLPIQPLKGKWRRPDLRNHRKILVVDGTVAFTGSQNLIEPGYDKPKNHRAGREWVELMARVEGPAVAALDFLFASDWYAETGVRLEDEIGDVVTTNGDVAVQVVPSGPAVGMENNLRLFTSLIYAAERRLSLTSPYFVPDESLLYAVTTAARRGVDVELFVSEAGDQFMVFHAQRSYYEALLRAGVRIYLYPAPAILHSKFFTVDDDVAVLGSSNMDMRSFALNYEVSLMLPDRDVLCRVRQVEDTYRAMSEELTLETWTSRSRRSAYVDNVMRLTAALQ